MEHRRSNRYLILILTAALVALTALAQATADSTAHRLYLLATTPTPVENLEFASRLYVWAPPAGISLIRDVTETTDGGVDSVQVNYDYRIITVASPQMAPHDFFVVRMDDPAHIESHHIEYAGSGFKEHLLEMPGRRLVQSIVNGFSPDEAVLNASSGIAAQRMVKPRNLHDPVRFRTIGVDLFAGGSTRQFELAPADAAFITFAGEPGPGVRSIWTPSGDVGSDGKSSNIEGTDFHFELPERPQAKSGDLVVYHVLTSDLIALSILDTKNAAQRTSDSSTLYVRSRSGGPWSSVVIPGSDPTVRAFGKWIAAVISEDNRKTPERASPGKEHRDQSTSGMGYAPDERFEGFGRYYPGRLLLYNADTHSRIELNTGEGDSEILLISGSTAYYRVNDTLYQAEIGKSEISKPILLAKSDVIRDVHWAFLGQ